MPVIRIRYIALVFFFFRVFIIDSQVSCLETAKKINKIDSAIHVLENCIPQLKNDTSDYVQASCHLSKLYTRRSQFSRSEKLLANLQDYLSSSKNIALKGIVLNCLATTYKINKENDLALKYYLEANNLLEGVADYPDLISNYTDLAELYRSMGDYKQARSYIKKGFSVYRESGQKEIPKLIRLYNRYAAIENEQAELDSSMYFTNLAIKFSRQIGDKYSEAVSLNELGFSLKNRNLVDTSYKCYQRAIDIWLALGAEPEAVHAMFNQARLLAHNDYPPKKVIPYYKNVIDLVNKKHIDYWLDEVYFELGNSYVFTGDSLNYYRYRMKSLEEVVRKNSVLHNDKVNDIQEKYENEKYKNEISKYSEALERSEKDLSFIRRENLFIYLFLFLSIVFLAVVYFLLKKIKKTNKILEIKNKEKDSLIQEIHHRVKNNLQFVSSLINLQIGSSKHDSEKNSLSDVSRRIKSMALVHEMLYNREDLNGIEINNYLSELLQSINELVNSNQIPIDFKLSSDQLKFTATQAISIGIIASELITNSIKYAFKDSKNPKIEIELKAIDNNKILFRYHDNGKGFDLEKMGSGGGLGTRLIDIFSRQIQGEYNFTNIDGLTFILVFDYVSGDK